MTRIVVTLFILLSPRVLLAQARPTTAPATPALRVLFIGDEYTAANGGIDQVLQALAKAKGRAVECVSTASAGKTLQWHWEEGGARQALAKGKWDYVVLQEQATRAAAEDSKMYEFARQFDAEASKAGAKLAFFQTWSRPRQPAEQAAVARAYDRIADELGATLVRVPIAWERAQQDRPDLKLHADDAGRPTPAGTYLAAAALYATLLDDNPVGLPGAVPLKAGAKLDVPLADALVLQRAARWAAPLKVKSSGATATTRPATKAAAGPTTRTVFIVDATGTMLGKKFELLGREIAKAIDVLEPTESFTVIAFAGGDSDAEWAKPFSRTLLRATPDNKAKAAAFMERLKVVGKGTNPMPALRLGFQLKPDVIYFLSDGEFNNVVSYDVVIAEVNKLNAAKRVRLNTIAFMSDDPKAEEALMTLARDNGGRFIKVGEKDVSPSTAPFVP